MSQLPIFFHSLFRSSSTYMFNAFRQLDDSFLCFQEPIHEHVLLNKDTKTGLLEIKGAGESQKNLNHPELSSPYFQELYDHIDVWRDFLKPEVIYEDYFGLKDIKSSAAYLNAITSIDVDQRRIFIQDCRTALRIKALKRAGVKGFHCALIRNPWDQWWSNKSTRYFDTIYQIVMNMDAVPDVVKLVRKSINFQTVPEGSLIQQINHRSERRLSQHDSYLMFFTFWCLSQLEARSANLIIDVDMLSTDITYRNSVVETLKGFAGSSPNFEDFDVSRRHFFDNDRDFFIPIQEVVFDCFLQTGASKEQIAQLRCSASASENHEKKDKSVKNEISELRRLVFKMENRETEALKNKHIGEIQSNSAIVQTRHELKAASADADRLKQKVELTMTSLNAVTFENTSLKKSLEEKAETKIHLERHREMLAALRLESAVELNLLKTQIEGSLTKQDSISKTLEVLTIQHQDLTTNHATLSRDHGLLSVDYDELQFKYEKLHNSFVKTENALSLERRQNNKINRLTDKLNYELKYERSQLEKMFTDFEALTDEVKGRKNIELTLESVKLELAHLRSLSENQVQIITNLKQEALDFEVREVSLWRQIRNLERQRLEIFKSTSWRIGAPLRMIRSPRQSFRRVAKSAVSRFSPFILSSMKIAPIRTLLLAFNQSAHTNLQNKALRESDTRSLFANFPLELIPRADKLELWNDKLQ